MGIELNAKLYSQYGVDTNSVSKVANSLLSKSEPAVQNIDYSKFNRASLGVDLYSNRTNADLQKQVALTQAGLYAKSVDVARLNAQAAANLYSANTVQRNVSMAQSVASTEMTEAPRKAERNANLVELFNISDKNSNSSNGFNPFESASEAENKNEKEAISLIA